MQNEIGTLKPGAYADVALFEIVRGDFPFYDVRHESAQRRRADPQHADH